MAARRGNITGIVGMVIAIATTLASPGVLSYSWIAASIVIGGTIGTITALKIQMTALPQLVAAFHSLVGLAAVFVATAAFFAPEAYGIGSIGHIHTESLIEMSIGTAIGAITFSGSIIAFSKLQGIMSGAPLTFPGQHPLNAALGAVIIGLVVVAAALLLAILPLSVRLEIEAEGRAPPERTARCLGHFRTRLSHVRRDHGARSAPALR